MDDAPENAAREMLRIISDTCTKIVRWHMASCASEMESADLGEFDNRARDWMGSAPDTDKETPDESTA